MNSPRESLALAEPLDVPLDPQRQILDALQWVVRAWESDDWAEGQLLFSDNCMVHSNAHGTAKGFSAVKSILHQDHSPGISLLLRSSNPYAASNGQHGATSLYVYGERAKGPRKLVFGVTLTGQLHEIEGRWQFLELRISVNWLEGDRSLAGAWNAPARPQGWQVGDAAPTIVSELDSPWARHPAPSTVNDAAQQLCGTFSRYAWAIDQGDIGLLVTCFTADVTGHFPPLGHVTGIHSVVGQLKAFRQLWPWMQHFGRPLLTEVNATNQSARMVIGRVMPQQATTPDGQDLYGAHYELSLRRDEALWKIYAFDYRPGWITSVSSGPDDAIQASPGPLSANRFR